MKVGVRATVFPLCSAWQHAILGSVFGSLLSQNGGEGNDSLPCAPFPETSGLLAADIGPTALITLTRPVSFDVFWDFSASLVLWEADNCNHVKNSLLIYMLLPRFGVINIIFVTQGRTEWLWPSCCTRVAAEHSQRRGRGTKTSHSAAISGSEKKVRRDTWTILKYSNVYC